MKRYVDGFVIVVPKGKLNKYWAMAKKAGKLWMKNGALQYFECKGDDLNPDMGEMKALTFPKMIKSKSGETVVFSFIIYKSKSHRNSVNAKVMKDPAMKDPLFNQKPMPFDMKRLAYGGFSAMVNIQREK